MAHPHQTASGAVTEAPLVLTDAVTGQGVAGHGIVFTYTAAVLKPTVDLIRNLAPLVEGEALVPAAITRKLAGRLRLLGTQGLVGMAPAGIDMALWDVLARAHTVALLALLGGAPRPVPAYGVIGYDGPAAAALGEVHGIPLSSHVWPELSAQLLCATPAAHWLEDADRFNAVIQEPLRVEKGMACVEDVLGTGVEWQEESVSRYAASPASFVTGRRHGLRSGRAIVCLLKPFRHIRKLALLAIIGAILAIYHRPYLHALVRKSIGREEPCPWIPLLVVPWAGFRFEMSQAFRTLRLKPTQLDTALDIERIDSPTRPFWIKRRGTMMNGRTLLAFVLAEQDWIAGYAPRQVVRPGDVVVDVGAHVGTFGDDALRRGAARVIMVEADPVNVECIRRNFPREIAAGRVVVVPEGAWSSESTLQFSLGIANSGTGSFVVEQGGRKILVKVRPLDDILRDLNVTRVDFIKMDIEGAEREALQGAAATLRRDKPRLMLDAYHLSDDSVVLPRVIRSANAAYREFCPICAATGGRVVPYVVFFE